MIWILLAIAVLAFAFAGFMAVRRRRMRLHRPVERRTPSERIDRPGRSSRSRLPSIAPLLTIELAPRIEAIASTIGDAPPWRPAAQRGVPADAPAIEYALMSGDPRRATELAEAAIAADPESPRAQLYLAWTLCANAQPGAALLQIHRARAGDASLETDAFRLFLACRAEHLQLEHTAGAIGACPPLVTTADLNVLALASGHTIASWVRGESGAPLTGEQARAANVAYREATARALVRAVGAVERAPGFVDAAYLVARLAIKSGYVDAGRKLFAAIAPLMAGRPDAKSFERDHADLEYSIGSVVAAKTPPLARRTRGFTAAP